MTLHPFVQYIKYRWKAKGRHGTHSPFVYDFIEQVLLNKEVLNKKYIVAYPSLPLKYENLICRIAAYFDYKYIVRIPTENVVEQYADMLLLDESVPLQWAKLLDENVKLLKNESAVLAINIHKDIEHTKGWQQLCNDPKVKMSVDLYGIGLLFFREEFKERQHFILKY